MTKLHYFPVDFDQTYIKMFGLKSSILLGIVNFCIAFPVHRVGGQVSDKKDAGTHDKVKMLKK